MNSFRKSGIILFVFLSVLFVVSGQAVAQQDTVAQPQDKLSVRVQGETDLTGVFTVSQEGTINYPLLGDVYVDGLSLPDIKTFLTDGLARKYLVNPQVDVIFFETPRQANPKTSMSDSEQKSQALARSFAQETFTAPSDIDTIDSGDKLNIQVYKEPDLSGVFAVSTSGKISYPILGEIYVQDMQLDQFKDFLYQKLNEKYVIDPQIEISFTESQTKSVAVLGQVVKPGSYILTPNLTLLKLMSQIGGFTSNAATGTIRVVRSSREDGKKQTLEVNIEKIVRGQNQDMALKAGDIIFVDVRSKEEEQKKETDSKVFITILGQVIKPGNYFYSPNLTLIRLVGQAGGFSSLAATSSVKIVRTSKEGKQESFVVNAGRIMGGKVKDIELQEGDLVVVPESYF